MSSESETLSESGSLSTECESFNSYLNARELTLDYSFLPENFYGRSVAFTIVSQHYIIEFGISRRDYTPSTIATTGIDDGW